METEIVCSTRNNCIVTVVQVRYPFYFRLCNNSTRCSVQVSNFSIRLGISRHNCGCLGNYMYLPKPSATACLIGRLKQHWLLYDFLVGSHIVILGKNMWSSMYIGHDLGEEVPGVKLNNPVRCIPSYKVWNNFYVWNRNFYWQILHSSIAQGHVQVSSWGQVRN